ncbi:MAG: tRNA preQ1(34) S-adenosylmethionine ribosyltransferase-isomerase QueA [Burkholderiaceae bacterium]
MDLADFDFDLPAGLIAQQPLAQRSGARLLHLSAPDPRTGAEPAAPVALADRWIRDLPGLLLPGDLLVVNDSKVIPARLIGQKDSGGRIEVLIERVLDDHEAVAMLRTSKPARPGTRIRLAHDHGAEVTGRDGRFYRLRFDDPVMTVLQRAGQMPLPPYIERAPDARDDERYQTVFARAPGSVAAPTAGLHFDDALLAALAARDITVTTVTLHVGAGTFSPVRGDDIDAHQMHAERYWIAPPAEAAIRAARARGGRVVAVGTTALRTLESAARAAPAPAAGQTAQVLAGHGDTRLFLRPGDPFLAVDRLLTNFHLPRSTLVMLVAAFAGLPAIRAAYAHAIAAGYRFFSYGDAMLIDLPPPRQPGARR